MTEPLDTKAIREREADRRHAGTALAQAHHDIVALLSELEAKDAEIARLRDVLSAARNIRHWHDAMKDNSGMVVSAEHVRQLWASISAYDAALAQEPKP